MVIKIMVDPYTAPPAQPRSFHEAFFQSPAGCTLGHHGPEVDA